MLLMGILTLFSGLSWGQFMSGYPSMTRANPSSGEWYADDNRAQVTTITPWGANMKLNLEPSTISGSFSASNRAIVIQMIGSSSYIGHWEEVDIINVNPSGDELEVSLLSRGYSTADPNDRVQVIQLEQFGDLTLDKVFVKCHPWDGNTGGVLALKTNSITMKSSVITAAGCGFKPEDGYSFGKGGQGAPGDTYYDGNGGGEYSLYFEPCLTPDPAQVNKHTGTLGTDGDPQVTSNVTQPTSANNIFGSYPLPNAPSYIAIMGNAGYIDFGVAYQGGVGGNGDGHGGKGGASGAPIPELGMDGSVGLDGGKGGNQGRGARGGGIILLKTKYIEDGDGQQQNISRWLDVSGANGANGEPGQVGGKQGFGGLGGTGIIVGSDVYYSGAIGGSGEPGDAAGGGDGSYGGAPGTIQLAGNPTLAGKSQFYEGFGSFQSKWIGISPGKNGIGGKGAYKLPPYQLSVSSVILPDGLGNGYDLCTSGGGGGVSPPHYTQICDCDMAMYPFTLYQQNTASTYTYIAIEDATNVPDWKTKYDIGNGKLISTDEVNKIEYHCRFHHKDEATEIFKAIAHLGKKSRMNKDIVLPAIRVDLNSPVNDHFVYKFKDDNGYEAIIYESEVSDPDNIIQKIDFDAEDEQYSASYSRCNQYNPPSEDVGETSVLDELIMTDSGPDGNDPRGHVIYSNNPSDHFGEDYNAMSIIPKRKQGDASGISIRHNSIADEIRVVDDLFINPDVEASKHSMQCELYDLSGRLISSQTTFEPSIQLNTRTLSAGVYILKVIKGSRMATSRIIVE